MKLTCSRVDGTPALLARDIKKILETYEFLYGLRSSPNRPILYYISSFYFSESIDKTEKMNLGIKGEK